MDLILVSLINTIMSQVVKIESLTLQELSKTDPDLDAAIDLALMAKNKGTLHIITKRLDQILEEVA